MSESSNVLEMKSKSHAVTIPSNRKEDFEKLIKIAFDINLVAVAINKSSSLRFAMDQLVQRNSSFEKVINSGKTSEKIVDGN